MRKYLLIFISCSIVQSNLFGQDIQYSQYYANPLYLNPAFTGGALVPRIYANYRLQWPSLNLRPNGISLAGDYYFGQFNSGVGVLININNYSSIVKNNEFGLFYAYNLQVNEKSYLRLGIQGSYAMRSLNFGNLLFPDQIANGQPTQERDKYPPVKYFDFSSGILYYSSNYWLGLSLHHLNRPSQSIFNSESGRLASKFSIHGGYTFILDEYVSYGEKPIKSLSPTFNYKKQEKFEQLDIGCYYTLSPFVMGLFYRGLPLKKDVSDRLKNESIGMILGFKDEHFYVGYSLDLSISRLSPASAHEISFSYRFEPIESKRFRRRNVMIATPEF
jgi:type IX secretion system PorP/SprF family membrane protein